MKSSLVDRAGPVRQASLIRRAEPTDASALREIYRPAVEHSAISFELEVPNEQEFAKRIVTTTEKHEWLVMERANDVVGYAYATPHRARAAYRYAVETSVYVHSDHHGQGIGSELYVALFDALATLDYRNAYAGITLPNVASVALHERLGFEPIGVFREVGYKLGSWHDVGWWQRPIEII